MRRRILAALLLLALLALPALALADAEMDGQVDDAFRRADAVGGAFVVAKGGRIVYERYYGVQQKTTGVPVTEKTYFRCASVTKLVTGIALMRLMERGELAPDADISDYLGYKVRNPRYPQTPITLRMLMSHTAGLNETASYSSKSSLLQDMLDVTRKARANFRDVAPGTQYTYSNFGAGITGAILESVSGLDVSTFVRQELFEPLNIDAAYTVHQLAEPDYVPATYRKDGSLEAAPSYLFRQPYEAEANPDAHYRITVGSLYIRPRDLTRLGIALCGDGTVDGLRVLNEASLAQMRQPQSPETTGITADSPYSFFTIRQETLFSGRVVYGHQGTSEGVVCNLYYEPISGLVLCVMTNGCDAVREDGIMSLTRRLAGLLEARGYLDAQAASPAQSDGAAAQGETAQGETVQDAPDMLMDVEDEVVIF